MTTDDPETHVNLLCIRSSRREPRGCGLSPRKPDSARDTLMIMYEMLRTTRHWGQGERGLCLPGRGSPFSFLGH
jgi:hypothetical protein